MNIFMDQAAFARSLAEAVYFCSASPVPRSLLDRSTAEAGEEAEADEAEADEEAEEDEDEEPWSVATLFGNTSALEEQSLHAMRQRLWRQCAFQDEVPESDLYLQ